jgi:cytochrome c biogenesis protein
MSEQALPPESVVSDVARLPDVDPQQANLIIEKVWRFFCSLELTLVNMLLIFFGMIAGTFVNPSNDSLTNIEKAFAAKPMVLWAYRTFELYDLFHSWWFTGLMLSLALNLVACSLERLPRIYFLARYPEKRIDAVKGVRFKGGGKVPEGTSAEGALAAIVAAIKGRGFSIETLAAEPDGAVRLFAEKGRFARFGVWVVHLSLLLVLGGGVYGRLTAFEGISNVPQNAGLSDAMIVRLPDGKVFRKKFLDEDGKAFIVRCDDFRLKEFEPGRAKAFESDLKVFERQSDGSPGKLLDEATINVNHPLRYGGLTFYQASYQKIDEQERAKLQLIDKLGKTKKDILLGPGEPVEAADGLRYQVVDYNPDYNNLGPAVQLLRTELPAGGKFPDGNVTPANAKTTTFWVFSKAPRFDADNREDRFAFAFEKLQSLYATGLQVAKDPSTPVIYTGCFLLFAGIFIAFFTAHKRIWVKLDGRSLSLGGAAHRNAEVFGEDFDALCAELGVAPAKKKKAPSGEAATA